MITFEEALAQILAAVDPMPATRSPLRKIGGRVLAEPIVAKLDLPPFDNSAVDGFGVRVADVAEATDGQPCRLKVVGTVRAGDHAKLRLSAGSALKILTGACVPAAVDAVVMREYCHEENGAVFVKRPAGSGENIRRRGGEFLRGQEVLPSGILATPPVVGLLANMGYDSFATYKLPKAVVLTTGDELTKPGRELQPGKIYDSNSYAMQAVIAAAGIEECLTLHTGEDYGGTKRAFLRALNFADVIISTGGVSVGDYDFVKPALEALGVKTELWRIAIKPGKPVYFGVYYDKSKRRKKYVFGLPGNPVSALVTYHQLVKPALAKLMGLSGFADRRFFSARLASDLHKKPGRAEFVRAKLTYQADGALSVQPSVGQDSHMLGGLAAADVLIHFPLQAELLAAGTMVCVEAINWQLVN